MGLYGESDWQTGELGLGGRRFDESENMHIGHRAYLHDAHRRDGPFSPGAISNNMSDSDMDSIAGDSANDDACFDITVVQDPSYDAK